MRWWHKLVLGITIVVSLLYTGSILAMFISPEYFWPIAFAGLAYFPIICVYLIFIIIWLFLRKKVAYILLILLIAGSAAHFKHFSLGKLTKIETGNKPEYTVLQYNVQGFDAYNKEGKYKYRDQILENIRTARADIICLEEFNTYHDHPREKNNLEMVLQATGLQHYYYFKAFENERTTRSFGLIILSRFPIIDTGRVKYLSLSDLNATIYADIVFPEDTVRVYCNHLQSTQLSHYDLEFIEASNEAETNFDADRITNKLKMSFSLRAQQADSVSKHLARAPFASISCGDFNDTPVSYTYHKMAEGMQDAFLARGIGIGASYSPMPVVRIDYQLFKEGEFHITSFSRIRDRYSDHYPCITKFTFY